jgi:hypothetical protein
MHKTSNDFIIKLNSQNWNQYWRLLKELSEAVHGHFQGYFPTDLMKIFPKVFFTDFKGIFSKVFLCSYLTLMLQLGNCFPKQLHMLLFRLNILFSSHSDLHLKIGHL